MLRGDAPDWQTTNVRTFIREELKDKKDVQAGITSENYIQ